MRTTRTALATLLVIGGWLTFAPAASHAQKKQRDLITREEIVASAQSSGDLLQVIRNLRPRFLEPPRGVRTLGNAMVVPTLLVVDGNRQGGLDGMQMIMAANVQEVRYMEPSKAENEYGAAGASGAVVVKLVKGMDKVKKDSL